ncbi:MAG: hypothetical protein KR126chlam3_00348 [Chlamydiae bacterium]|nr:hypothetical protein [Chlamydiota bacterium]
MYMGQAKWESDMSYPGRSDYLPAWLANEEGNFFVKDNQKSADGIVGCLASEGPNMKNKERTFGVDDIR